MSWLWLVGILFVCPAAAQTPVPASPDAVRALFKQGKFHEAADSYRALLERESTPEAYMGLTLSMLKADEVNAADESSQRGLAALPQSALTHAARGDVLFRRGHIFQAEDEYKAALKIDGQSSRAWLGQGRVDAALSRRTSAATAIGKAHELDPEDGDALYEWALRQPYPDNVAALEKHLAEFHNGEEEERHERELAAFIKALAGRRVWISSHDIERTEIKLELLTAGPGLVRRGYGLRVRLNDRATVTLLLDTGSSGITITRKLAEKIGAQKLSEQSLEGVGKSGPAFGYKAWVDKIAVGDLEFHDCFIHATPHEIAQVDGTIGTDVFSAYLVTLDLRSNKLRLEPLPARAHGQPTGAESFSRAFSFGHFLLVSTAVGKKVEGLFVVDSGSNTNTISPELARLIPEMRALNVPISGASGSANSAFMAKDATLSFAQVRRSGERISTLDLHSISKDLGVELSGQIGFTTFDRMKVVIDYRDGLVQFLEK